MSPLSIMILCFASVALALALGSLNGAFARKPKSQYGRDDGQADVQPDRDIYRDLARLALEGKPAKPFGTRRYPPPRQKKPTVFLTPRMVGLVNIERRRRGVPMFNRKGLQNAIAHPWDNWEVRQPQTAHDWLTYLVLFEILAPDHHGYTSGGCGGVTIDPNAPYNGQGGEFAGAGASGKWSNDADARTSADAIISGSAPMDGPNTSASDPTRSYSAPDTSSASSISADTSPV